MHGLQFNSVKQGNIQLKQEPPGNDLWDSFQNRTYLLNGVIYGCSQLLKSNFVLRGCRGQSPGTKFRESTDESNPGKYVMTLFVKDISLIPDTLMTVA